MARQSGDATPVMDRDQATGASGGKAKKTAAAAATAVRTLSGPWGASFDGTDGHGHKTIGLTFERRWTTPGIHPYDEIAWEQRTAAIGNESGKLVFEAKRVNKSYGTSPVVRDFYGEHVSLEQMDQILITHAHFDHFGGLA